MEVDYAMAMEFPVFQNDDEMAEWFEAHDIEPEALASADDITFSHDLRLTLVGDLYTAAFVSSSSALANAPTTTAGERELVAAVD